MSGCAITPRPSVEYVTRPLTPTFNAALIGYLNNEYIIALALKSSNLITTQSSFTKTGTAKELIST